jgi:hypothetical protein
LPEIGPIQAAGRRVSLELQRCFPASAFVTVVVRSLSRGTLVERV